ncbi:aminoglycoside phosphotransferase family protein, partial [Halorubrum sp. SS5]
ALAALHADRFPDHGEIVGAGTERGSEAERAATAEKGTSAGSDAPTGLSIEFAPWSDVLLATVERTREIGTSERLADHYDAVIDCVRANRETLDEAPAALLHGDVTKPN